METAVTIDIHAELDAAAFVHFHKANKKRTKRPNLVYKKSDTMSKALKRSKLRIKELLIFIENSGVNSSLRR